MSKLIPLTQGKFAIVDDEDYERLSKYKWHACKDRNTYYAARTMSRKFNKKKILMHRQILKAKVGEEVDHHNHYGLDNRKENIRICNHSQNQQNLIPRSGTSSKFKGVYWHKSGKFWGAEIKFNGKSMWLGSFENEVEAALAYDAKAKELFGEFAKTNF